jgi:hypothetical protein
MFGKTRTTDWDPNAFVWRVPADKAERFEEFIAYFMKRRFGDLRTGVSVHRTPRSGDQGRDIEVIYRNVLDLGGARLLPPGGGRSARLFIECKATSSARLDDSFLIDATQHEGEDLDVYALATNGVITPYVHYRAAQAWAQRGTRFVLLDRGRLYRALSDADFLAEAVSRGIAPETPPSPELLEGRLWAAAQSVGAAGDGAKALQTYLVVRNQAPTPQRVSLSLASDILWSSDGADREFVLDAGEDLAQLVRSERQRLDLQSSLRLSLSSEGRSSALVLIAAKPQLVLEPPFMGRGHLDLRLRLRQGFERASGFQIVSVHGEAGVGKTRTVEEALRPVENSRFVFRAACDPRTGRFDIARLAEDIAIAALRDDDASADRPDSLRDLIPYLQRIGLPAILLLEDLHHASPDDITILKEFVARPPDMSEPTTFIVTGRDDHTFPNADYYAFLDIVQGAGRDCVEAHELGRLSDADTANLIRAVAANLPEAAVARVEQLGQNNPFIIIEVLQYLLDVGLARLLSRRTIGVLDPERFKGLDALPSAVEELYERRFEALQSSPGGDPAFRFIRAASFFSADSVDDLAEVWPEASKTETIRLLIARRFVTQDERTDRLQFAHENLYHFLRRWIRRSDRAASDVQDLLTCEPFVALLGDLARGEAFSLAGRHAEAFALFRPAWDAVRAMTNFSSEEIDRSFYPFLPALFVSARAMAEDAGGLAKVASALGYMGVHNFPLLQGEQACQRAEEMLDLVFGDTGAGAEYRMAIGQLRSHALQNMGRTGVALRRMIELEAHFKETGDAPPTVAFDLYDRLQEHYRKANHGALMDHYGRLAAVAAAASRDEKIGAAHLITMSLTRIYRRGRQAVEGAERAIAAAERTGIQRFIVYNQLTGLIAGIFSAGQAPLAFREIFDEARELLRIAALNTFSDSIIRLQLLLATLAPHVHADIAEGRRIARLFIAAGQESSVRFGIGLYDWALDNLAGALDLSDTDTSPEQARQRFDTCLERLRRRGLTFVGACSGTYPNVHAIANILRFRASFRESDAVELIRREITAYDAQLTSTEEAALPLVGAALAGRPVFWPSGHAEMLRLPGEAGYFTPIF